MNIENTGDLKVEEEEDDVPYVEFDISVSPSDPQLQTISRQLADDDIIIPFYQRKYVWKVEQASRLIESFLMGLPVPQVFLYQNDEEQLEVIDGQQRLLSVHYFLSGYFGGEDSKGKRQTFRLKGLSERSEYNGKAFDQLSERDQRKLKNATIRAINIRQLSPHGNAESVFHIFERLNTGGTQLKPQEIRNAVYRGKIVERLKKLNSDENWQTILGLRRPDKAQKDVELVLRLASLYKIWPYYEKPMLRYLNSFMSTHRGWDHEHALEFEERFIHTCNLVAESLDKPFRPKRVVNAAILESIIITLMENSNINSERLLRQYPKLLKDQEYLSRVTGATTDTAVLRRRIERATEILTT